jgi:hypothetical protein
MLPFDFEDRFPNLVFSKLLSKGEIIGKSFG